MIITCLKKMFDSGVEENVDSGVHDFAVRFPSDEGDNEELHSDHAPSDELISIDGSSDDGDSRRRSKNPIFRA